MGRAQRAYQPRQAEASVLPVVIREYVDDFLRAAADRADGAGLPEFIVREFREFLTCGVLAPHPRCGGGDRPRYWSWAALVRRAFDLDPLRCPCCAGQMQRIATIDEPTDIQRILAHLGLPGARAGPPSPSAGAPARAEPPARPDLIMEHVPGARPTAAVCVERSGGQRARSRSRCSGLTCPARSDTIGNRCHG